MSTHPIDITPDIPPLGPLSGNASDDDGRALDEAFEAAEWSPQEYRRVHTDREDLPIPTRMIARSIVLNASDYPVQMFPMDLKRHNFAVWCGDTAQKYFIGSEQSDIQDQGRLSQSGGTAAALAGLSNGPTSPLEIPEHTGAIWVGANPANAGAVVVTVVVVTE